VLDLAVVEPEVELVRRRWGRGGPAAAPPCPPERRVCRGPRTARSHPAPWRGGARPLPPPLAPAGVRAGSAMPEGWGRG
jgi:hypothetical protein